MKRGDSVTIDINLPKHIDALGVPYQVKLVDVVDVGDDDCVGETHGNLRIIKIQRDQGTRRQWTTLLHELVHAILHTNGVGNFLDGDTEEVIAQSLEHGIEMFMRKHGKQFLEALEK